MVADWITNLLNAQGQKALFLEQKTIFKKSWSWPPVLPEARIHNIKNMCEKKPFYTDCQQEFFFFFNFLSVVIH